MSGADGWPHFNPTPAEDSWGLKGEGGGWDPGSSQKARLNWDLGKAMMGEAKRAVGSEGKGRGREAGKSSLSFYSLPGGKGLNTG